MHAACVVDLTRRKQRLSTDIVPAGPYTRPAPDPSQKKERKIGGGGGKRAMKRKGQIDRVAVGRN
jgi:hypothetical protein